MSKKKRKSDDSKNNSQINISLDYDKLAEAIVKANKISTEKLAEEEKKANETTQKNWLKLNHLDAEKQPKKFFQAFWWFIRFPFIKKENIEQPRATYALEMLAVIGILKVLQILFGILIIVSVLIILNYFKFSEWSFYNLYGIGFFVFSWLMYGLVRMSAIEIDKMQDRQMLLSILSAITSFVAMVVAIVALFV